MPAPLGRVVEMLSTLPGVGPKTAMRLGLNLLSRPASETVALADALKLLHEQVGFCDICGCFAEKGLCQQCDDPAREGDTVCIVEQPVDVLMMERGHNYRGHYHVLHGRLSPVDGVGPEELNLAALDRRVEAGIKELILATSATVDGEATAHYIARRYRDAGVRISRIARGVPEGGELEYLDEHTLSRALDQRISWDNGSI
ncbi:DNA replication and repair protein RecR [Mariprofundus ferrinatatus]|uniref:Recombination protein RecR n=1 Tax=Mariprofundus ferrinatatus TaxID=1921087 RepID=A0A2K8L5N1_9PROT|nr:recombination mediator RecR [Mariprofundus ferrinatatus]ATX81549.1 DNA replication and repair protein RecR [Mariprofundus ferrinatatus]